MRVLLGQLEVSPGDAARNVERLSAALGEHPDADLAVFPELYLCGHDVERVAGLAIDPGGPHLEAIRSAAAEHHTAVVVGYAERLAGGEVANSVACIAESGAWAGNYRKTHLFGPLERAVFTQGDELLVAELAGVPVAPMVCFDVEFPEPARAVARAGARLLVTVAANMAPYGADHELAAAARALGDRGIHREGADLRRAVLRERHRDDGVVPRPALVIVEVRLDDRAEGRRLVEPAQVCLVPDPATGERGGQERRRRGEVGAHRPAGVSGTGPGSCCLRLCMSSMAIMTRATYQTLAKVPALPVPWARGLMVTGTSTTLRPARPASISASTVSPRYSAG